MRIIFNLMSCSLGQNGGSSTIVKSANTLVDLGHNVYIIDSMKNKHKWTPLKAKHIIVKNGNDIPNADVVIATGYTTVLSTINLPKRCGLKAHWIRGWETWKISEANINKQILQTPTMKIVNSICLQKKLKQFGVESDIIRPGYDFNEIYPLDKNPNKSIVIGGLSNTKHASKRTSWVLSAYSDLKVKHKNIELWMMGTNNKPDSFVTNYVRNPNIKDKNRFYNQCDIWLAPTTNEGLHICPAEAMITECPVVGTNAEMSGLHDYLEDGITGLISKNKYTDFLDSIDKLVSNKDLRVELGHKARLKILSLGDRITNMKRMFDLFERRLS